MSGGTTPSRSFVENTAHQSNLKFVKKADETIIYTHQSIGRNGVTVRDGVELSSHEVRKCQEWHHCAALARD